MNTLRTDRVRFLLFIKKRPDITMEEFDRYWLEEHSKVFLKFVASSGGEGLLKYEQLHVNHAEKARLKSIGARVLDYDGLGLFDIDSFERLTAILNNEEYIRDVKPDEAKLFILEEAVLVRTNFATIIDRDEVQGSAYLKSLTKIRQDHSRMLFTFSAIEGVDLSQAWLQTHAEVVKASPLGQRTIIKYEQLYPVGPVVGFADNPDLNLPHWDGVSVMDVPSFNLLEDPVSMQMIAEDVAKWQVPGTLSMLPIDVATIIDTDVAPV